MLKSKGKALLQRTIDLAEKICPQVICVLGHNSEELQRKVDVSSAIFVTNELWSIGMGSSIAAGVKRISENVESVLILLCDQYLLELQDMEKLVMLYIRLNQSVWMIFAPTKMNNMGYLF